MKKKLFGSIQARISIAFMLLSLLFALITVSLAMLAVNHIYHNQTMERLTVEQQQIQEAFRRFAVNTNQFINSIIIQLNSNAQVSLLDIAKTETPDHTKVEYLMRVAGANLDMRSDVTSINIVLNNGIRYSAAHDKALTAQYVGEAFLEQMADVDTRGGFVSLERLGYEATTQFYCKELRDIAYNKKVGYVFLEIPQVNLQRYCMVQQNSAAVVISESCGKVVANAGNLLPDYALLTLDDHAGRYTDRSGISWMYVSGETIPNTDWNIICLLDTREAVRPVYQVISQIAAVALGILTLMAAVILMISRQLASPIKILSKHMANVTTELPGLLEPNPHVSIEIKGLYENFNAMILQNRRLFEEFKNEQATKRRLELGLLQSQIKPHFLYNTLDTIYCLAVIGRNQEAASVTKALADYYRVVLNNGQEWINLRKEWHALAQYLTIMQIRFPDVQYEMTCPAELESIMIPKLLLQPLVENAIQHGFHDRCNKGRLRIWAEQNPDGAVELCVADDGVGFSQERFMLGLKGVRDHQDWEASFGLQSVLRRLELFYGERGRILLETDEVWTVVKIRFYPGDAKHV